MAITHPAVVHALEDSTSNIHRRRVATDVPEDITALQAPQATIPVPEDITALQAPQATIPVPEDITALQDLQAITPAPQGK